jgi:hypothetical protein
MLYLFNLIDKLGHALHKGLRVMIMDDVHVNPMTSACQKSGFVVLLINASSYTSKDHCSWEYRFQVPPWHL